VKRVVNERGKNRQARVTRRWAWDGTKHGPEIAKEEGGVSVGGEWKGREHTLRGGSPLYKGRGGSLFKGVLVLEEQKTR